MARLRRCRIPRHGAALARLPVLLLALSALALAPAAAQPSAPAAPTTRLQLWFGNERLNPDPTDCTAAYPVERTVPRTQAVATASLLQLFAGPTPAERAAGYHSPFSAVSAGLLKGVHLRAGTAYVDLHDLRSTLGHVTSSCGAAELHAQVSRTLRRFPSIDRVVFAIDGDPRVFYAWVNEACGPANDDCDPRPFGPTR